MIGTGSFELQLVRITNVAGELRNGSCCDGKHALSYGSRRCLDPCDTFVKLCVKQYGTSRTATGPCRFGSTSTPVLGENSFDIPLANNKTMKDGRKFNNPVVLPFTFSWMVSKLLLCYHASKFSPARQSCYYIYNFYLAFSLFNFCKLHSFRERTLCYFDKSGLIIAMPGKNCIL